MRIRKRNIEESVKGGKNAKNSFREQGRNHSKAQSVRKKEKIPFLQCSTRLDREVCRSIRKRKNTPPNPGKGKRRDEKNKKKKKNALSTFERMKKKGGRPIKRESMEYSSWRKKRGGGIGTRFRGEGKLLLEFSHRIGKREKKWKEISSSHVGEGGRVTLRGEKQKKSRRFTLNNQMKREGFLLFVGLRKEGGLLKGRSGGMREDRGHGRSQTLS